MALGAGVSGPDASDSDPLLKLAAWPDWSWLAKHCLPRVAPRRRACAACCDPLEPPPRWRSKSQLTPRCGCRSWRLGPGCHGPYPAPQACSLARLVTARQVLSPSCRAACAGRGACAACSALRAGTGSRSWLLGPGCFGPGPAPQAGSLARLVKPEARQVLSPSRRAACRRACAARCDPPFHHLTLGCDHPGGRRVPLRLPVTTPPRGGTGGDVVLAPATVVLARC